MIRRAIPLFAAFLALATEAASGQRPRPDAAWRTVATEHFDVHYPNELATWSLRAAGRLEAIYDAVAALVGNEPAARVDVLVHDPFGISNGFAGPGPLVVLWPNPPDPTSMIGEHRGWAEILSVHEIAHVAHLEWPSRNPGERRLWRWIPIPGHAIAVKTPRWAREGYATWVEGRVTGSGRPHGTWRPTVLRQWALEGRLPSYGGLDGGDRFLAGSMAYLAGSAFLEWLVERAGEESLTHLWRRLTARSGRDFREAFAGVFGGPPAEVYARFTAEVTARAIEAERRIEAAPGGRVEGEPFQRLAGGTGAPAVSPDGDHVAVVVDPPESPSRLVVWSTAPDTTTAEERAERERALELDPEDVPAVEWRPEPREPVATLWPVGGRSHRSPRFLPDGRIAVVRMEGVGGGRSRSDLFVWNWREGELERVTHGAGIREADPGPDGRIAVAARCAGGRCDVVRVDLANGAMETIAPGGYDRSYSGPRISPDGTTIVAAVQAGGRWRLEAMAPDGSGRRLVDPDDGVSRFDPAFTPDGEAVLAVSDRGGILDLERVELASAAVERRTRTTGAAVAPAVAPDGELFFLVLRSRGWQLHRSGPEAPRPSGDVEIGADLAPAARVPPVEVEPLAPAPVSEPRSYGLGPRFHTPLPQGFFAEEGWSVGASVVGTDPVGRLRWSAHGWWGAASTWRGAGGALVWSGWGPRVFGEAFALGHEPSEQDDPPAIGSRLDLEVYGVSTGIELEHDRLSRRATLRLGSSLARLDVGDGEATRGLVHVDGELAGLRTPGRWRLEGAVELVGAAGRTLDEDWRRARADGRVAVGRGGRTLRLAATWGWTDEDAPLFERFAVGGVAPPLVEGFVLAQRVALPTLPAATLVGRRALVLEGAIGTGSGLAPFFRAARGGAGFDRWVRVAGLEASIDAPAVPYFRIPAVRARFGIGRVLDGPNEDEQRVWLSARFHP